MLTFSHQSLNAKLLPGKVFDMLLCHCSKKTLSVSTFFWPQSLVFCFIDLKLQHNQPYWGSYSQPPRLTPSLFLWSMLFWISLIVEKNIYSDLLHQRYFCHLVGSDPVARFFSCWQFIETWYILFWNKLVTKTYMYMYLSLGRVVSIKLIKLYFVHFSN